MLWVLVISNILSLFKYHNCYPNTNAHSVESPHTYNFLLVYTEPITMTYYFWNLNSLKRPYGKHEFLMDTAIVKVVFLFKRLFLYHSYTQ